MRTAFRNPATAQRAVAHPASAAGSGRWRSTADRMAHGVRLPLCGVRPQVGMDLVNGDAVVVRGVRRFNPPPTLYATAVSGEVDLTLGQVALHALLPGWRLLPRRSVLHGMTRPQFEYQGYLERRNAEDAAVFAASAFLGMEPALEGAGARVLDLDPGGPASALQPGDVIVAVDGATVSVAAEAGRFLAEPEAHAVTVLRRDVSGGDGEPVTLTVQRPARPGGERGLRLGTHRPRMRLPVDVEFELNPDSAGPSCGLMLALAVVDVLTPGSLTAGRVVAGTGTISVDGRVGEIGWTAEKVQSAVRHGAEVFLVPTACESEARRAARGRVTVIPVSRLDEAVTSLKQ